MQGLLDLAEQSIRAHNADGHGKKAGKIREIRCSYGLLACFEEQTLQACFEIFSEDTVAAGATLVLEPEPLACKCEQCGKSFSLLRRDFKCPYCGAPELSFRGGNGLTLQAIEVEEENGND